MGIYVPEDGSMFGLVAAAPGLGTPMQPIPQTKKNNNNKSPYSTADESESLA